MMVCMISKTFIVQIYRWEENEPDLMVGTIEDVEKGRKDKFTGLKGLWERLMELQRKHGKTAKRDGSVHKKERIKGGKNVELL